MIASYDTVVRKTNMKSIAVCDILHQPNTFSQSFLPAMNIAQKMCQNNIFSGFFLFVQKKSLCFSF